MAHLDRAETAALARPERRRSLTLELQQPLTTFAIAFAVFWLAFDHGAFATTTRASVAVVAAWALALGIGLGIWLRVRLSRPALAGLALLVAFALLQVLSIAWGATAEDAFAELNRTLLYAAVLAIVACAARRVDVTRWLDAIALGLSALMVVALASRFFPRLIAEGTLPQFLPDAHARLSYPVGYWNGLAVLCALAVPLLLRIAGDARPWWVRGAAIAAVPGLGAVIYLSSSRTGAVVAVVGGAVFVAFAAERWRAAAALATAAAGSAALLAFLSHESALVNGPLGTDKASSQGRLAAVVLVVIGAAVAAASLAADRPLRELRIPRRVGLATVGALAILVCVGVVAADPVQRWHNFTRPAITPVSNASSHFASLNGNWRWQLWSTAFEMFRARPLAGHGVGTFEPWWTRKGGSALGFVGNAHSFYLQTLGELGAVGFVLVVALVLLGIGVGVSRALRAAGRERTTAAAIVAAFTAFALSLGLDWMWQLPAVTIVGVALLGLALATDRDRAPARAVRVPRWARAAAIAAAVVVGVVEGDLLLATRSVESSQRAAASGDLGAAYAKAQRARALEPWAASPYLQLALVAERRGRLVDANRRMHQATTRDRRDWRFWLIAARIAREAGYPKMAHSSYDRALGLAPRSEVVGAAAP